MKFENPSIEICIFDNEDIVTGSGTPVTNTDFDAALSRAEDLKNSSLAVTAAVVKITF